MRRFVPAPPLDPFRWTVSDVANATGPDYNVRCYLERRTLRELLRELAPPGARLGVEVGCGYGRLTMVLTEFCESVVGLEREGSLLEVARPLLPDIEFRQVERLTSLPLEDGVADVAMTFTVLQHMTDEDARGVVAELKRIVAPGGLVLLMEKTDPESRYGDVDDGTQFLSQGRTVETWADWLAPLPLVHWVEGKVEPTCPGYDRVGAYMAFRAPERP